MHRFTQQAVMLFTLLTLPPAVLAGSTKYNILNYPDLQNGWTLTGTITTDGFIGDINQNDIKSWTWTITSGATTYTANSTDPGASTTLEGIEIQETPTEILLQLSPWPWPADSPPDTLFVLNSGENKSLTWTIMYDPNYYPTDLIYTNSGSWYSDLWMGEGVGMFQLPPPLYIPGNQTQWILAQASAAAVPEPASLYLVGFGAVCGCVYVMGHKRRARRTATTDA